MTIERCPICDWPLAARREDGCVPGDCSFRPGQSAEEYRRIARRRAELATDGARVRVCEFCGPAAGCPAPELCEHFGHPA